MRIVIFLVLFSGFQSFGQNWLWLRSLGMTEWGQIEPDNSGGFYANYVVNVPPSQGAKLARYDGNGNQLWLKPWTYNTTGMTCLSNNDLVLKITQTNPVFLSNDTIAPNPTGGNTLVRIDESLNLQAYVQFRSGNYISYLKTTSKDQIFVSGILKDTLKFKNQSIVNPGSMHTRFAALCDTSFNLLWHTVFDVRLGSNSILKDENDNLVISGTFYDTLFVNQQLKFPVSAWGEDSFIIKMSSSGQILWHRIIKGARGLNVSLDQQNNIFAAGDFRDSLMVENTFLKFICNCNINLKEEDFALKYNDNGDLQWINHIGKTSARVGLKFFASPGGYYYFTGEAEGHFMLGDAPVTQPGGWHARMGAIKPDGQLDWTEVPQHNFSYGTAVHFNKNKEAFFFGFARFLVLANDSVVSPDAFKAIQYVAKMAVSEPPVGIKHYTGLVNEFSVFPNPTSDIITINFNNPAENELIEIFNAAGQLLRVSEVTGKTTFNVSDFPQGLYFLHLKGSKTKSLKLMKE